MSRQSEKNEDVRIKNKQEIRRIEQEYCDSNLIVSTELVRAKRAELEEKLTTYVEENKLIKYDKEGNPYEVPNVNPVLIQKYFFQSINPMVNVEPNYSAEKLGIVWQIYEEMIARINAEIGVLVPSVSGFCSFAGIRLSTFKRYKQSADGSMRIVVDKIEDGCFDSNVTLAQMGYIKERSTVYRMKSEQERVEKESVVEHNHKLDVTDVGNILNRVKGLQDFNSKRKMIVGEIVDESK